jgi:hypothetical protein
MVLSHEQNVGQNRNRKIGNTSSERVEQFKNLRITLTNQNSSQEEIENKVKSGNTCYYSVQNLLSSSVLSEDINIKLY